MPFAEAIGRSASICPLSGGSAEGSSGFQVTRITFFFSPTSASCGRSVAGLTFTSSSVAP